MAVNSKKTLITFLITKLVGNVVGLGTIIERLFRCPLKTDGSRYNSDQNRQVNEVFEPRVRGRKVGVINNNEQIDSFLSDYFKYNQKATFQEASTAILEKFNERITINKIKEKYKLIKANEKED